MSRSRMISALCGLAFLAACGDDTPASQSGLGTPVMRLTYAADDMAADKTDAEKQCQAYGLHAALEGTPQRDDTKIAVFQCK